MKLEYRTSVNLAEESLSFSNFLKMIEHLPSGLPPDIAAIITQAIANEANNIRGLFSSTARIGTAKAFGRKDGALLDLRYTGSVNLAEANDGDLADSALAPILREILKCAKAELAPDGPTGPYIISATKFVSSPKLLLSQRYTVNLFTEESKQILERAVKNKLARRLRDILERELTGGKPTNKIEPVVIPESAKERAEQIVSAFLNAEQALINVIRSLFMHTFLMWEITLTLSDEQKRETINSDEARSRVLEKEAVAVARFKSLLSSGLSHVSESTLQWKNAPVTIETV